MATEWYDTLFSETVTVHYREYAGTDNFGDDVWVWAEHQDVKNVLINPSTTTYDRIRDGHPEGIRCDLVIYMPKDFDRDVRGACITVRGVDYDVVGSPITYTPENLPASCAWNMVIKLRRSDG